MSLPSCDPVAVSLWGPFTSSDWGISCSAGPPLYLELDGFFQLLYIWRIDFYNSIQILTNSFALEVETTSIQSTFQCFTLLDNSNVSKLYIRTIFCQTFKLYRSNFRNILTVWQVLSYPLGKCWMLVGSYFSSGESCPWVAWQGNIPSLPSVFLSVYNLYLSRFIICIYLRLPSVFLSVYHLYFS